MQTGMAIAGNMIVDTIKRINVYPSRGQLASVTDIARDMGGSLCNVITDLAVLDSTLELKAIGVLGADELGEYILARLGAHANIDSSLVRRMGDTSFTDVMSESTARTFFHYRGSNALLSYEHFQLETLNVKLLHVGYILLLDALDAPDGEYGTVMARLLHDAQARGIRTSIDVVSEQGDRFAKLVPPSLAYCDYCVINEVEAEMTTGVALRSGGELFAGNMQKALNKLKALGVKRWAVIHAREAVFGLDEQNNYYALPSLDPPSSEIKGTVGAGDAFLAGILYGAYHDWTLEKSMKLALSTAACSLSEPGATAGMRPLAEALALYERVPKMKMP